MPSINTTPPPKRNPTRRGVIGALAAGSALVGAPALVAANPADDSHLFGLIRQLNKVRKSITVANADSDALLDLCPDQLWTVEEMTVHRILEDNKKSRFVSLEDIEKNDRWDHPGQAQASDTKITDVVTEAGKTRTTTMVSFFPKCTEADLAAWRERCAARRALYDAKLAAQENAERLHGADVAQARAKALRADWGRLRERIAAAEPSTVAGVLAKIRLYVAEAGTFDLDGDLSDIGDTEALLASAMADLNRLAGGAA